jgi:Ni2+-binding GTPase involved in maturation of urease and hydrogenase
MKLIIIAGTPGSGKTSIIKHVIEELKTEFKLLFAKFDCLKTQDDELISQKTGIATIKKLAEELCPDHYTALVIPQLLKQYNDKDIIIIETAGLCLRCSPYLENSLGINILDVTSGNPNRYGPILNHADIVAISKGNLISQAEREIFRTRVIQANKTAKLAEVNGLSGEGAADIVEHIKDAPEIMPGKKLTLKHSMPSAVCGFCYGNKVISRSSLQTRFLSGKKIKNLVPNLNCGKCGFKTCNEFIRSVLDGKTETKQCPFIKSK